MSDIENRRITQPTTGQARPIVDFVRPKITPTPHRAEFSSSKEYAVPVRHATIKTTPLQPQAPEIDETLLAEVSSGMQQPLHAKSSKKRSKKIDHNPEKRLSIEHHINELRKRALGCTIALIIGGVFGYKYQKQIIAWLIKPLGQQLFYTSPTGGFDFLIKICLFFGFLLAVPIIIYNIIRFIAPAVPQHVTYSTFKILSISVLLALAGVSFAYYVSLPAALHFLNGFTNQQVSSLISAQEYFNFVMIYLAGFAALFQMPLIFAFLNKIRPMKPKQLMKKQKIIILVSFIIAPVLTPTPDPINQTIMAVPIILLYQTSIIVVWQDNKRRRRKDVRALRRPSIAVTA